MEGTAMTHLRAIRRPRLRCEVTRYVGRHGSDRVAKVVLLGAIPAADAQDRLKGAYDCIKAFSETDLTQDLPADRRADPDRPRRRRPDRPHQRLGSAVGGAGPRRHPEGVPGRPRAGPGGPDQDQFNTDLLDFLRT